MTQESNSNHEQEEFYAPPATPVLKKSQSYSPFLAGMFGAVVAAGASSILVMLLTLLAYNIYLNFGGEIQNLYYAVYGSDLFNFLALCLTVPCDVFGGYVSARVGNKDSYRAAFSCALLIIFYSCFTFFLPYPIPNPTWSIVVGFLLVIPACLYGANIFLRNSHQLN